MAVAERIYFTLLYFTLPCRLLKHQLITDEMDHVPEREFIRSIERVKVSPCKKTNSTY
jgi:hypothetical protein